MRRPTPKSRRLSKKVRPEGKRRKRGAQLLLGQAAEGSGLRRGALWVDQLAQQTLSSEGFWPALGRETRLQVDLPVRGARSEQWGELVHVPAGDGWVLFGGVLGGSGQSICRVSPASRARWGSEPHLRADHAAAEREALEVTELLPGIEPGRKMVPGV
jgi:hypothetical protein